MASRSSDIVFEPWTGEHYAAGIGGKRVLVLGESHYHSCEGDERCREETAREKLHREMTRSVVGSWKDKPHFSPVSSRVPALFGMKKAEFWERVAFYNYLQSFAGPEARMRPREEQWASPSSQKALQQVLNELQPDRVLVLGKSTWAWLPSSVDVLVAEPVPEPGLPIAELFGAAHLVDQTAYWYAWQPNGKALAFPVRHPSEYGFSPRQWTANIRAWLSFEA